MKFTPIYREMPLQWGFLPYIRVISPLEGEISYCSGEFLIVVGNFPIGRGNSPNIGRNAPEKGVKPPYLGEFALFWGQIHHIWAQSPVISRRKRKFLLEEKYFSSPSKILSHRVQILYVRGLRPQIKGESWA